NVVPEFFSTAEGIYDYKNSKYIYQYKDHLGNVRLSYADIDGSETIDSASEILEENNYYPFGLKHQGYNEIANSYRNEAAEKYKYGGKEWNEELGLNLYDFHARNYDPAIGRWLNMDPLAEQFPGWSPYNYTMNNPINFTDPTGMAPEGLSPIFDPNGKLLGTDDQGVKGNAIIMNEKDLQQGMSHEEPLSKGALYFDLPSDNAARSNAESFMKEARDRPDYDGFLTYNEANSWARKGSLDAQNKYGNGDLFIDVRTIDVSKFSLTDIQSANNKGNYYFNFLSLGKAASSTLGYFFGRYDNNDTGMIFGNIRLEAGSNGTVHIGNRDTRMIDLYDFNTKDGSYYKRGANALGEHISTMGGKYKINNYSIYGYGTKRVQK